MPTTLRDSFADDPLLTASLGPQHFTPPTSGTATNGLPILSWSEAAAQITRTGLQWGTTLGAATTVTYAYRDTATTMPTGAGGFSRFDAEQIAFTEEALKLWAEVANITFVRHGTGTSGPDAFSNNATMLFGNYSTGVDGAAAFAFYPGSRAAGNEDGDVWVNITLADNANLIEGGYGAQALAHEIGHAIGLSHPGDYDASDSTDPTYENSAEYWQDARMFSIMSYFGSANTGGSLNAFASGPQLHDIAAAQRLYGANMTTRTGDTIYGFNSNTGHDHFSIASGTGSPVFAIWDAGGNDTLDLSGYTTASEIDLREEAFSSAGPGNGGVGIAVGNISIARGAVIENAIGGAGADTIIGNNVANSLLGNAGNDTITGLGGDDIINGGNGIDQMDGGDGNDTIFYAANDDLNNVLGGAGNDILVFTSGAAPTSFNLATHGFETAEGRLTDTEGQPWATQTDYYTASWALDLTVVWNDNGTHSNLDFDQANAFTWSTSYAAYDSLNRLDTDVVTYDDGTRAVRDLDQANVFNWSSTWAGYTSTSLLDTDVLTYDDNSHAVRDFDQANAFNWSVTWASYTTTGVLDIDVFTYDDGSTAVRDLDQADSFTWETTWASYTPGGLLDVDVVTYDDGTYAVRDLDQANAFAWAQMWWLYDAGGTLLAHQTTYDDGSVG